MTGIARPWWWSLPTRVELAEGGVIEFKEHGQPRVEFSRSQIDKMFEVGLMQSSRTSGRALDAAASVTLDGDARFLVGEVDLGREVGLEVLVRGLEAGVDASYREHRERHPRPLPDDDRGHSSPREATSDEPELLSRSREVIVSIDDAGERLDALLGEVEQGAQVFLVKDGKRVVMMTPWRAYVDLREQSAGMAAASWSAWRSGVFDAAGCASDVTGLLHRRPRPATAPGPSSDDDRRTAQGGDTDERRR